MYKLFVPKQAVGANLVYFDLFNPSTGQYDFLVHALTPVVSGAVAVTGVVGVDLLLTRTTAVGTGGTAATFEGTDTTACTISCLTSAKPGTLRASDISARLTPTGGATAGAVLSWICVFSEETNAGTYNQVTDMIRSYYADIPPLVINSGTGIRIVQGAVASVGNIGFNVFFSLRQRP